MSERKPKLSEAAMELVQLRDIGELAKKMGIKILELSAERAVATMPVLGNTQPLGLLHGGAHLVLAETLGSFAANVWAHPTGYAVGIEISATHSRCAAEGVVTGTARAISLGKTLATHEIVVEDEKGNRLSTIRITNLIRASRPSSQAAQ